MTLPEPTPQSSNPSRRRRTVRKQLAAYSVAAAGTALAADSASAAVIPIQLPGGQPVALRSSSSGPDLTFNLDINGDGINDFQLSSYLGVYNTGIADLSGGLNQVATEYMILHVRHFNAGDPINDQSVVINGFTALEIYGGFIDNFDSTRGYAGVKFDIPGGSLHYAYLDVGPNPSNGLLTLFGGAWESEAGAGIVAGSVPEPSGVSLLALGAAGVAAWRRKRS